MAILRTIARTLDRRTLLRGMGGVAVGLPALEIMGPGARSAHAAGPARFVLSFGGISTGRSEGNEFAPTAVGRNYDVRRPLKPLVDAGIRDDVSVVSGLLVPYTTTGTVPPGGKSRKFHSNNMGPVISGMSGPATFLVGPRGPSADQVVAEVIAGNTQHRVLAYRVEAFGNANKGRSSWKNATTPQEPIASPRLAYQSLFTGFSPPADGGGSTVDTRKVQFLLRQRKSVLDFVSAEMQGLMPRLGRADRVRMEKHHQAIRDLEARVAAVPPVQNTKACRLTAAPAADPALDPAGDAGWNNEDLRADVLTDLLAMAFTCDLSRVASFMLTNNMSFLNTKTITGINRDAHGMTHVAGPVSAHSDTLAWHVRQWSKLVTKLKAVIEPDGVTLLDRTAAVLVFEGGNGYDPESGSRSSSHSTENMVVLIAGRAGGLKAGQHVVAKDMHPVNVLISAMTAVGMPGEKLGEVRGNIPQLFQ